MLSQQECVVIQNINISTQKKGLKRNTIDKYYTKKTVVELCVSLIKQYIHFGQNDLIIEPSAGNGSFITSIKELSTNTIFYDLEPEHSDIIKQDYLTLDYRKHKSNYERIHVIGNPPFGRQSSLAIQFIRYSCLFCNSISFILPKSFKKDSLKAKIHLTFHLIYEFDLPNNSFLVDDIEHNVPCVFQIWEKKIHNREISQKLEPTHFIFVDKSAFPAPDISFRRIGVNAGIIDTQIDNKSIQSHYFIRFTNNKTVEDNIVKLSNIAFEFNNTVGPRSISKQELIKEIIKVF